MEENDVTGKIIGAAMRVHSALGPGLLESAYLACLVHDLPKEGLNVETQVALPIVYDGIYVDAGYRLDMVAENIVIAELKSVEKLMPIHTAQLLSYLKLSGNPIGLLINFNEVHLRDGIKRLKSSNSSASSASSVVNQNKLAK